MALSLLCGGLGVAEAFVHVNEVPDGTKQVYTTDETYTQAMVDEKLNSKANATNVATNTANIATNKANITALQSELANKANESDVVTALGGKANTNLDNLSDVGKLVIKDTIKADVYSKTEADATFATQAELNAKANVTALDGKANIDLSNLTDDGKTKIKETMSADMAKKADKTYVDTALAGKADKADLDAATGRIGNNETNIAKLQEKTKEISHADGDGTRISGVTIKDGNIIGNNNSTITGLTDVETGRINGKNLANTAVATEKEVNDEKTAREEKDNELDGKITTLDGKVTTGINELKAKDTQLEGKIQTNAANIQKNKDYIAATDKRTGGITRNNAESETKIEGNVTVDNLGNVTAQGKLKGEVVDAGAVNAGSLSVENASTLKGDVTMDKKLSVTGETSLGKTDVGGALTVTGKSDLKGDVTLGTPNGSNTVAVNGTANFNAAVNMANGLNVTNGETNLKKTTVDGNLKVTGTITTDKMVFGDKATNNYTEIDKGHITSKNDVLAGDATKKSSSMELDHTKLEVGVTDKDSKGHLTMTADKTTIKNSDLDGKNYSEIVADKDSVTTTVKDEKDNTTSTKSRATEIRNYAKDKDGNMTINAQTATQNKSWAKDKDGNESSIVQTGKDITNTAEKGTITNKAQTIVNNASGDMTNTVGGQLNTTVTGQATEDFNGGLNTNVKGTENHTVTGNQNIHVTKNQTNKIDGDQENTIGGNQTTTVTGDISNKAENITNKANTKLTDKVGGNTRVLDSEGITDTVGGSTFKQRIDKIMMESKDVSIKAEETLTNEAKVITNKASEVINNEAVNINNTATGIIKSKASEIQNQADKLISNKVGENTWENMENGKITTSIKDGAKQNLTQSDAAGTTQSTVDGGKSTVTIQNADGLADAVTDGTNTSVQNQTASAIAAAVKDGAGNENASVANATTSVNTIKSGSKANTVISTADGTSFINSEAAAPVGDGTEVKTTIKGNTITTGKVTMDYAEVMKDLGVRGNANIAGKTTTGSLEVKGESKLTGDVTMESNATVKKDLTVEGNTNLKNTKVDGTLDVTQKANFGDSVSIAKDLSVDGNATIKGDVTAKSYKVGDKTYISEKGINANNQKITNVADGSISEGSKDAVNGGQLYTVKNDLEGKVNKVGANAAAMANLHPMEFDPDSKWNIAAAIGNYGSETAAALGAFYRPNDDVMVNLSTAFGTGENMVGGGVSVRLGKGGNKLSREESNALKDQVNDLTARMDALLSVLNPNMSKDFPDVPENHWAYEAVSRLAGNDIVQGYPDGEFHGERTMTRYEMAEIIYNALSRGAEAEKELVEEFKPELQAMAASEKATAERAEG